MTRFSIPSETHPESIDSSIHENYQPELGLSDWELQMAKLVGFEQESPIIETETEAEADENAANLPESYSPSVEPEASTKQALLIKSFC